MHPAGTPWSHKEVSENLFQILHITLAVEDDVFRGFFEAFSRRHTPTEWLRAVYTMQRYLFRDRFLHIFSLARKEGFGFI